MFSAQIFVTGLPTDWDEHEINARFSLAGTLQKMHFVKSATGLKTGKVVITYEEKASAELAVTRFDNQAIDGKICSVKPFINKENNSSDNPRKNESLLARRVYLMNVPYDATNSELETLVAEFASVDQVVIPRDK